MLSHLSQALWADWIWFPEGHGWADLTNRDGKVFPKLPDLWVSIPITICFLFVRQIFERWVSCKALACLFASFYLTNVHSSSQDSRVSSCLPAGRAWQKTGLRPSESCPGGLFLRYIEASHTGAPFTAHVVKKLVSGGVSGGICRDTPRTPLKVACPCLAFVIRRP